MRLTLAGLAGVAAPCGETIPLIPLMLAPAQGREHPGPIPSPSSATHLLRYSAILADCRSRTINAPANGSCRPEKAFQPASSCCPEKGLPASGCLVAGHGDHIQALPTAWSPVRSSAPPHLRRPAQVPILPAPSPTRTARPGAAAAGGSAPSDGSTRTDALARRIDEPYRIPPGRPRPVTVRRRGRVIISAGDTLHPMRNI
jgi:hypothetical protein